MPITGSILQTAAEHGARIAISGPDGRVDYAALVASSRRTAAVVDALHAAQPHPPTPAAETGGIPITATSVTSAFHAGRIMAALAGYRAVSATIDPRWPVAHRVRVITRTGIGVVISDDDTLEAALRAAGWTGTLLTLDEFRHREDEAAPADPPRVRDADEPFLLLFSSGTTSDPKAFLKTRRQYRANVAVSAAHLGPASGVVTLAPGPVSYSLTLYAVIEALATGGSVHVADRVDPIALGRRIRDAQVTRVVAVPAIVQALTTAARRAPERFASMELVVTGGANLPASIRAALGEVLPDVGLTSYYGAAEIGFIGDSRAGDGTAISVYDGIDVDVRDDAGMSLPDGELGALWVRADACSDGYLSATSDEVLRGADGWATVHDQARRTGRRLELVGRRGDIAITGGHKVALTEVERAFDTMDGIGAVCAVALPHPVRGTVVALLVESPTPDRHRLQDWARSRLAPQAVPRRWLRVDSLPRTVGGKIRRAEARAQVLAGTGVPL